MIRVIWVRRAPQDQADDRHDQQRRPDRARQCRLHRAGPKLTYDIHYQIRLVEASSYDIDSYATLKGFVSGLYAGNYDITHIFIDSL